MPKDPQAPCGAQTLEHGSEPAKRRTLERRYPPRPTRTGTGSCGSYVSPGMTKSGHVQPLGPVRLPYPHEQLVVGQGPGRAQEAQGAHVLERGAEVG